MDLLLDCTETSSFYMVSQKQNSFMNQFMLGSVCVFGPDNLQLAINAL